MLAIITYFLLSSGIFLAQQAFLWTYLDQLHELGFRLPLFILINNFLILFCLLECVEHLKQRRSKLTKLGKKRWRTPIVAAGVVCLAFTFMEALYFWHPYFTVFYTISGDRQYSLLLATGGILLSGMLIALTRLPVLVLGSFTRPRKQRARAVQILALLPLMHLCEAALLVIAPTLYPVAFQLPVALKKNLAEDAYKAAELAPQERTVYLFNPNITHRIRQQVFFTEGNEGFESAGKLLGIEIRSVLEKHPAKLVTVILPEVTIYANQEDQVEAFARSAIAQINKKSAVKADFLFGVQLKGKNLILYQQSQGDRHRSALVREKNLLFPFFEKKTFGIDLGAPEAKKNLDINFPILNPKQLPPYAHPQAFDICYESLHLQRWQFGKPKLVLTNHAAFYDSSFLSKGYDLALQTLGVVFRSPLVLVGNRGLTGVFVDQKDLLQLNQFFNSPKGKQVRFVRVVGF